MKYEIRNFFAFDAAAVADAMLGADMPAFLEKNMKSVVAIELLERSETENVITRRVRYRIKPVIESIGPKKIPPEAFEWVEQSSFDKRSRTMTYENIPTKAKIRKMFENRGEIRIVPAAGGCERVMTGELKIHFPLLGAVAEKVIYRKAAEILEEEAAVLRSFLSGTR